MVHDRTAKSSSQVTSAKARQRGNGGEKASARVLTTAENAAPRRRPRQERAKFTVAAILEAAALVIDEMGWSRASTNRIAERAGVSIGSLYQYFPNKEAILAGLFEEHHREVDDIVGRTIAELGDPGVPVAEILRKLLNDLIEMHRRDRVVARVLSTRVPMRPTGGADETAPGHSHEALVELLKRRPDVRDHNLGSVARILEITVEALTRWMVHEAPEDTDLNDFVDESVAMLAGLLSGNIYDD